MGLLGKHQFGSIGEVRVTFVEKSVPESRMSFLKELLEVNGYEVVVEEEAGKSEGDPTLYTVGVTDMVFNPTVFVFQRRLKTIDGKHKVCPDYWNQNTTETKPQYWKNSR